MRLVLADPSYFKDSISIISELVNEARFKVTNNALELVAMDPANVAMVIFKLFSSCFAEYQIEKETEIAINLGNLKQILRRIKANDLLSLELTGDNKLKIQLKSNTTRTFSIPLIDLEEREQKIPQLEFPISIALESTRLSEAIEDADIVAESVQFNVADNIFSITAEGDLSHAHIELREDENTKLTNETGEHIKAKYSLEYLKKMVNGAKLAPSMEVYFSKDYPLKLDYKVIDKLALSFILAPRVEND
ncbi:proliferating cell nuclear antigen (pcna) [Candidatus Woesearchaeota archaeon]|nr:proliferating cell nuclear antigen (pcna) [Candidatus Woesearchaeota archaeon]